MALRSIESGVVSLTKLPVRADMKAGEPCGRPNCDLDMFSEGAGRPHNMHSALNRLT